MRSLYARCLRTAPSGRSRVSGGDAVEDFWRPIKRMVAQRGLRNADLGRRLNLSPSAVSELLNGRRAKAPDWDVVRTIVELCLDRVDERRVREELDYRKRRLEELETALDRARTPGETGAKAAVASEPTVCPLCAEGSWDITTKPARTFDAAARLLGGGTGQVDDDVAEIGSWTLCGAEDLARFRERLAALVAAILPVAEARVRGGCRAHRIHLWHAARVVAAVECLVASPPMGTALDRCGSIGVGAILGVGGAVHLFTVPGTVTYDWKNGRTRVLQAAYEQVLLEAVGGEVAADDLPDFVEAARAAADAHAQRMAELGAEHPALFAWSALQAGTTTSAAVHDNGLPGLESALRALTCHEPGADSLATRIVRGHRRALAEPISLAGELREDLRGVEIPSMERGYVNPAFRAALYDQSAAPHVDSWWSGRAVHDDIAGFLAGELVSAYAPRRLLMVLGDPGTGKSLLTRLLAARLPPGDYLPVRIELRDVLPGTATLDQLERAVRQATLRAAGWEDVRDAAPEVLPVLIFDGFDELLQAGTVDQWNYLENLAAFQAGCLANGTPVAVVVTSRTVVADQAHIPDGTLVARLEPFDADRIERWLQVWNAANGAALRRNRGALPPSDLGAVHPELASQPLLLFMLALYYAFAGGAEPGVVARLSRGGLYERLLRLFVRRQVVKREPKLRPAAVEEKVERELDDLSVIAVAMFIRGRQGVSAEEAAHDLAFLREPDDTPERPDACMLFGRFFFIHEARTGADDALSRSRRWYEFLHATFGEYLVARKIVRTLRRCPDGDAHDGLLFNLLAAAPLTDHMRILDDLGELLEEDGTASVPALFQASLKDRPLGAWTAYNPTEETAVFRCASYSVNLVLLVLAKYGKVSVSDLVAPGAKPRAAWHKHAMLWNSQFSAASWDALTGVVATKRVNRWPAEAPDVALEFEPRPIDANVNVHRAQWVRDGDIDDAVEPALPLFAELPRLTGIDRYEPHGGKYSRAHALVALAICDPTEAGVEELMKRYKACLLALGGSRTRGDRDYERFRRLVARRLLQDADLLPPSVVADYQACLDESHRF
ncbi:helix-turn-helix domain-containing protein [Yinghuangia seranimata]|uniref:helix-turn-helix domain-containing protein n=1 Tax=Yinghuangia seranimata TaxID=408067 RepID=UPI00248C554D|nr:helix-turn-helix domain-containing protein [Yinghuangia seranimata]MDI2130060.1 hypothetical protein [Yinghuangia seranimata]